MLIISFLLLLVLQRALAGHRDGQALYPKGTIAEYHENGTLAWAPDTITLEVPDDEDCMVATKWLPYNYMQCTSYCNADTDTSNERDHQTRFHMYAFPHLHWRTELQVTK
jgi:hypothetical protein